MGNRTIPDWIFVVAEKACPVEPRAHMLCKRCGERVVQSFPIKIDTWLAMSRGFGAAHSSCMPAEVTAV